MKIHIINGANINMLGSREQEIYGNDSYEYLCNIIKNRYKEIDIKIVQSNNEGKIIDFIQEAYREEVDGIVINPGAYTHYSYAIYDAILSIKPIPVIEVHLSNIYGRDEFRKNCVTTAACNGQISGFGINSYILAVDELVRIKYE